MHLGCRAPHTGLMTDRQTSFKNNFFNTFSDTEDPKIDSSVKNVNFVDL